MEILQCLIADIPQVVLADIVQRVTEENENIEVVMRVPDIKDVPAVLSRQNIDVLIVGMKSNVTPQACKDMLKRYSDMLIVGLVDDGRQAIIYMGDVGCNEIVQAIKTLGKCKQEIKHVSTVYLNE